MTSDTIYYVSYWENAPGQTMPAYVALALVSMRRALGDRFLLLTPRTVSEHIDADIMNKAWAFEPLNFTLANGIEAIVAKSDFIRMAFVHRWGGAWLDADTLLFRDPTVELFPKGLSHKLHWHSECIFASLPGNPILAQALTIGLASDNHAWGNPGSIKNIIAQTADAAIPISGEVIDPGHRPLYNFAGCEVMRRTDIAVGAFLINDVAILKLYNTYFRRTEARRETVAEFLAGGSLLAKLFLHIEANADYWVDESDKLIASVA